MIGWINLSVEAFIRDSFGDDAWTATVAKAHVDTGWLSACPYLDSVTYDLVINGAELLGVTPAQALEAYGKYFVKYVYAQGYEKLLLCLGDSMPEFLANLNNLHLHLSMAMPAMNAPAFRVTDITPTSCSLHYYSTRPALWPIVKGVVETCAETMFHHSATMTLTASRDDGSDHEVFLCTFPEQVRAHDVAADERAAAASILGLDNATFFKLHPFHVLFDRSCRVLQCGVALSRLFGETLTVGAPVDATFSLKHPHVLFDFKAMAAEAADSSFLFTARKGGLQLKGSLVRVPTPPGAAPGGALLLLASPRLSSLDDLQRHGLFLSDMPLHDMGRDYVLLAEQRSADIDLKDRYELSLRELSIAQQKLVAEQARSQALLYQMLPRAVANRLLEGEKKVEAIEYPELSILFSDIVGFSTLCQRCTAREVSHFLNELYSRFDALCESPVFAAAQVYKVETIGDAYMLVCNLEAPCDNHADVVLQFAKAMHSAAKEVVVMGMPLRIRVGIHTASAVGGVVGHKRPQFCLFGDAVNTAARMESHGLPGFVHLSSAAYGRLRCPEESGAHLRGSISVKGLGTMQTYLVLGDDSEANRATLREALSAAELQSQPSEGARAGAPRETGTELDAAPAAPGGD